MAGKEVASASADTIHSALIAKAKSLIPKLRDRGRQAEENGTVSDETVAELLDARFHQICQPKRFGGLELDVATEIEVVMALARGCGSTAWIANVFAFHNWQVSMFPTEAQEEYWGDTPDTLSTTAGFSIKSEIVPTSGGVRISGHYKFASGANLAHWFIITRAGNAVRDWMLIPRADVEVVDTWRVSGMSATDSQDLILKDVFVPAHRILPFSQIASGTTAAADLYPSPFNRLPFFSVAPVGLAAAVVGMGDGLVDVFQQGLRGKRHTGTGELQIERQSNQVQIGEASAVCHSAKLGLRDSIAKLRAWGENGVPTCPAKAQAPRRDICAASHRVARMATNVALIAGSSATALSNPIQRFVRDIIASSSHAGLAYEDAMVAFGKAKLEVPDQANPPISQA